MELTRQKPNPSPQNRLSRLRETKTAPSVGAVSPHCCWHRGQWRPGQTTGVDGGRHAHWDLPEAPPFSLGSRMLESAGHFGHPVAPSQAEAPADGSRPTRMRQGRGALLRVCAAGRCLEGPPRSLRSPALRSKADAAHARGGGASARVRSASGRGPRAGCGLRRPRDSNRSPDAGMAQMVRARRYQGTVIASLSRAARDPDSAMSKDRHWPFRTAFGGHPRVVPRYCNA